MGMSSSRVWRDFPDRLRLSDLPSFFPMVTNIVVRELLRTASSLSAREGRRCIPRRYLQKKLEEILMRLRRDLY